MLWLCGVHEPPTPLQLGSMLLSHGFLDVYAHLRVHMRHSWPVGVGEEDTALLLSLAGVATATAKWYSQALQTRLCVIRSVLSADTALRISSSEGRMRRTRALPTAELVICLEVYNNYVYSECVLLT